MIPLGYEVKDVIHGFRGIVISRHVYLYGEARYGVEAAQAKEDEIPDIKDHHFDESWLKVMSPGRAEAFGVTDTPGEKDPLSGSQIKPGMKMRAKHSGIEGTVMCVHQYLSGCQRATIQAEKSRDGVSYEYTYDENALEVMENVDPRQTYNVMQQTGGPDRYMDPGR